VFTENEKYLEHETKDCLEDYVDNKTAIGQ
jgi:hypothetical protein